MRIAIGRLAVSVGLFVFAGCGSEAPRVGTSQSALCSSVTLTTDLPAPQASGTQVTLTGTASCTVGSPEYRFWISSPLAPQWTLLQDWNASPSFLWTVPQDSGLYRFEVDTRTAGSVGQEAFAQISYNTTGGNGPCNSVTLGASPATPQVAGTAVTFTGTATCGGASQAQYRFLTRSPGSTTWATAQDWSATNTFNWSSPTLAGRYVVEVDARRVGAPGVDSYAQMAYSLSGGDTCGTLTASGNPASPQAAGTSITITGAATCTGVATPQYRYWMYGPLSTSWQLLQDWTPNAQYVWASPQDSGNYRLLVQSTHTGSTTAEASVEVDYTLTGGNGPCSSVTLNSDLASPQTANTTVVFTGAATCGGSSVAQYRFYVRSSASNTWTVAQDWSTTNTFSWSSATTGQYVIEVDARRTGATGSDSYAQERYQLN